MTKTVKISGSIYRQPENSFRIEASYGEDSLGQAKEILLINSAGQTVDWQNNLQASRSATINDAVRSISISKMMREQRILSNALVKKILASLSSNPSFGNSKFTIESDNKLNVVTSNQIPVIHSFHLSSPNPRRPEPRSSPTRLTYKDLKQKTQPTQNNHYSDRISFYDYSDKAVPYAGNKGLSIMYGSRFAQMLTQDAPSGKYRELLLNYLKNTIKLGQHTPLMYQSLCVNTESNQRLGLQGAGYILKEPDFFNQELAALHELQQLYGYSRIKLVLPYIKDAKELRAVKDHIRTQHVARSHKFSIFLNLQLPANIIMLAELLDEGLDGIIFDVKSLSKLIVGMHTDLLHESQQVLDKSVLRALETTISETKKRNIPLYVLVPDRASISVLESVPGSKYASYIVSI